MKIDKSNFPSNYFFAMCKEKHFSSDGFEFK